MKTIPLTLITTIALASCSAESPDTSAATSAQWQLVNNFEQPDALEAWTNIDVQNETDPFVPNAQVTEVRREAGTDNQFLIRKPAADGIVGNRKALSFTALPTPIEVGETYTLYTRINVEYFPNNHSYGLSNLPMTEIPDANYDAFEPMIRITDKAESDGFKNDGTLMVLSGYKTYDKIFNPMTGAAAKPLEPGVWYEVWAVINNASAEDGGQTYDLYVRGGEFPTQELVYGGATFRVKREAPLTAFIAITNTGSKKQPYGNGGVGYDDIYIAKNEVLSSPLK
ncbi:hypothetical protein N9M10_02290 [Hellea sp.]|nr:hypothetical protein [Hellea sp.]